VLFSLFAGTCSLHGCALVWIDRALNGIASKRAVIQQTSWRLDKGVVLLFNMEMYKGLLMGKGQVGAVFFIGLTGLIALCCLPVRSYALGFGTLELNSHFNEPLKAKIPLLLSAADQMNGIRVELAEAAEYRQMGLPWHAYLSLIRVAVEDRQTGSPSIVLHSVGAIKTPILSIVLKAKKEGRGTYYRHYQLLMDPVETTLTNDQLPLVKPVASLSETGEMNDQASVLKDSGWARIARYGPVRSGDNLSEIAYRLRKDKRYSNRQVMLSLYEKNPGSFSGADINHLKQGSWLNVPAASVVKKYANADAMRRLDSLLAASSEQVKATNKSGLVNKPETRQQGLRYSGKINMSAANDKLAGQILNVVRKEADEKLETIHQQLMSGKLQMTEMGHEVTQLGQAMRGLKLDVQSIKEDVNILKMQAQPQSQSNGSQNYWLMALLALLAALLGMMLGLVLRRPRKQEPETGREKAATEPAQPVVRQKAQASPTQKLVVEEAKKTAPIQPAPMEIELRPSDEVDTLVNRIEENLGQCHYDIAEELLAEVELLAPSSLRAAVLRAQLYHETDRHDERNALINRMSESSDKKQWESFCHMLPTHVWQACFGDGSADHG